MKKNAFKIIATWALIPSSVLGFLFFVNFIFYLNEHQRFLPHLVIRPDLELEKQDISDIREKFLKDYPQPFSIHPRFGVHESAQARVQVFRPQFQGGWGQRNIAIHEYKMEMNSGAKIYDVTYSTDDVGRRRVVPANKKANKAVFFLGDSTTFGVGVKDEQTFASVLASRHPNIAFLNLGVPGGGPNDFLDYDEERTRDLFQGTRKKNYIFFGLIDSNFERAICRLECHRGNRKWILEKSKYRVVDGKLQRVGYFKDDVIQNSIFSFFVNSAFLRYFQISTTPYLFPGDLETLVEILKALKQRYETIIPDSEFIVLASPMSTGHLLAQLLPELKKAGLKHWDLTSYDLSEVSDPASPAIPLDGHPSAEGHFAYALLLEKKMNSEGILP